MAENAFALKQGNVQTPAMRILTYTSEYPPMRGGVASVVDELTRAFVRARCEVLIGTPVDGAVSHSGVPVDAIRAPRNRPMYLLYVRRHLRRLVREFQPDLIHVHGMRALEATKGLGVPVVFTNHTSGFLKRIASGRRQFPSLAWRMKHLALLLAPSDELVEAARTAGYHGPGVYVPNGVDIEKFQPQAHSELRAKYGIAEDAFVAVLARRLVEKNGVVDFARAFLEPGMESIVPLIVGDGDERAEMEKVFAQSKAKPIFAGSQPNEAMPGFYHAADIAVLPSYMEATSVTGLEAMACGLPLVGTRVGGIPDLIDEGKNGYLVEPRQPRDLAARMLALKQSVEDTRAMGAVSRRKVEEHFSWDSIARLTLDAIQNTLTIQS